MQHAGHKIVFFDHGTYIVTSTITIPAGSRIVGEVWSVVLGTGAWFDDMDHPRPVIKAGEPGSTGTLEVTDMIFATRAPSEFRIVSSLLNELLEFFQFQ